MQRQRGRLLVVTLAALALIVAACGPRTTDPSEPEPDTEFTAQLAGDNEVPAVATTATGDVTATLTGNVLELTGTFDGLESDLMAVGDVGPAHVHQGGMDENGPVLFAIEVSSSDQRSGSLSLEAELSSEEVELFNDGMLYVNIHTDNNPAGELRAQLTADAPTFGAISASFMAELSPDEIVPGEPELNGASPSGSARAILRGNTIIASGSFSGLGSPLRDYVNDGIPDRPDITEAVHIHEGAVGEAGPFVRQFMVMVDDDERSGSFSMVEELDNDERDKLIEGLYYVDVHTETNPGGELRGQLFNDDEEPTMRVTAELAGENEVPAVATTASGDVSATLRGNMLELTGTFDGLESDLMDVGDVGPAHLHEGDTDENGPVLYAIEVDSDDRRSGSLSLEVELSSEEVELFNDGMLYVNIHTDNNPAGELRAQLIPDAPSFGAITASFTAKLAAENEVPPVTTDSDAGGMGRAIVRGNDIVISGNFEGLVSDLFDIVIDGDNFGPAHVHAGAVGETGPAIIVLEVMSDDERSGRFSATAELDSDQLDTLEDNGFYINIHTEANQPGEIRGQLFGDEVFETVSSELAGENEVPAVATTASGEVSATLHSDFSFDLSGDFEGLESDLERDMFGAAGPAHLHQGAMDENGPVLFPLEVDSANERSGSVSLTAEFFDEEVQLLADGLLYVNIHSQMNPGGELRAQLTPDAPTFDAVTASFTAMLDSDNEVPEVEDDTDASGMGRAILRGDEVVISGHFEGLESDLFDIGDAGPAHVHVGAVGETGGVVIVLEVSSDDMRSGRFSTTATLDTDDVAAIEDDLFYINIHTEENQPGEIRGQLFNDETLGTMFSAPLEPEQETHADEFASDASGEVDVVLNGFILSLTGSFQDLEGDPEEIAGSAAHIHEAPRGEDGPVIFLIDVETDETNRTGTLSLETTLNDFQLDAFLEGNFYVNVHTEHEERGELRGQLEPDDGGHHHHH